MMMQQSPFRAARARYRTVDIASRVEGATPHQLVAILFDELLAALEATAALVGSSDHERRAERQTRAVAILHALEASLDHDKGGEIAHGLAAIYREARRLVARGAQENDPLWITRAHQMLAEIASAWGRIA